MNTSYQLVRNSEELRKAVETLAAHPVIGLDTETTDLDPYTARLRLLQLAIPGSVFIIDIEAFGASNLTKHDDLRGLRELLSAARPIKIAHNAKFDAKFLKHKLGIDLGGLFDSLLASQLVGAGTSKSVRTQAPPNAI